MNAEDKLLRYCQTHKRAATTAQLAAYFLLSTATVARALGRLQSRGLVQGRRIGPSTFWEINRSKS